MDIGRSNDMNSRFTGMDRNASKPGVVPGDTRLSVASKLVGADDLL